MKQANSKTPAPSCPTCGDPFEGFSEIVEGLPEPEGLPPTGSILICLTCGEVCVLDEDKTARRMTEAETRELPPSVVWQLKNVEACRQFVARKNGRNPFVHASVPRVGREGGTR